MTIVITDNIERECVNLISLYQDSDYVQKALILHYSNLSAKKLKSVSEDVKSYIIQALDFLNKTDDQIFTAPLNLYYSIYNFAKAIYYLHYPNMTLAGSHGLKLKNETADGINEIGNVSVLVESSGAFDGLISVAGDNIIAGDTFTSKDIFSIIPELREAYALRYLEEPHVFLLRGYKDQSYRYDLIYQTDGAVDVIHKNYFLPGSKDLLMQSSGTYCTVCRSEACTQEKFDDTTYVDVYGNRYLTIGIKKENESIKMSKIVAIYLSYYIFSMLARYYPEEWMRLCNGADSAIISKLVIDMRREMLVEVLQLLSAKEYVFETKLPIVESEMDPSGLWDLIKKEMLREKKRSGKNPLDFLKYLKYSRGWEASVIAWF